MVPPLSQTKTGPGTLATHVPQRAQLVSESGQGAQLRKNSILRGLLFALASELVELPVICSALMPGFWRIATSIFRSRSDWLLGKPLSSRGPALIASLAVIGDHATDFSTMAGLDAEIENFDPS